MFECCAGDEAIERTRQPRLLCQQVRPRLCATTACSGALLQAEKQIGSSSFPSSLPGLRLLQLEKAVGVLYSWLRKPAEFQLERLPLTTVQLLKFGLPRGANLLDSCSSRIHCASTFSHALLEIPRHGQVEANHATTERGGSGGLTTALRGTRACGKRLPLCCWQLFFKFSAIMPILSIDRELPLSNQLALFVQDSYVMAHRYQEKRENRIDDSLRIFTVLVCQNSDGTTTYRQLTTPFSQNNVVICSREEAKFLAKVFRVDCVHHFVTPLWPRCREPVALPDPCPRL